MKRYKHFIEEAGRCWPGHKPVPGKKPYSSGSCVKEEVLEEGRPSQRHPLEGHDYHKKTDAELTYIAKDAHKAAEAMKSHNTAAENKYRDQANDSATVRYWRQKHGMPDWYKKKYGHIKEETLNEGQYEMMMRNGQVKKFIAKDDADAKRIAAGHGAKSVIKLKGGVPAGKVTEQSVAEGKKPDRYHIVGKNGKPANLVSYADKASAIKDRDEKHPGAVVQQVGPRGKVKGVTEEVEQIDEVAAWQRKEGKSESGGLNRKGIESYRRENPGSKLSMAVTTKPSKLKPGSKSANRRKSFCARMGGMKKRLTSAKTANDPNSRINKALRKWNC